MATGWESDFYRELGSKVRGRRIKLGLSQAALAGGLNLSRASISNVEAGRQRLLTHQVVELSRLLDMPPADLIGPVDGDNRRDPEGELHNALRVRARELVKEVGA